MKVVSEDESILKVFLPVTNYYTKEAENGEKEHWITGRGSDTAEDREGDDIDPDLLQEWADRINESEVGLGCFPNHDINIDNLAAIHREALTETDEDIRYLTINSILIDKHPKFQYYLSCLRKKAPFFYSIAVLNPLFREKENGKRTIVKGTLISVDFVAVPANPRTGVRMKGGSYLVFENCAGNCEEDIMNEKDEERMKGIEDAMKTLTEQVQALVKAQETEKETQKNREEDAEKSLVETLVGKLTEIDEKVSKLSKESTGRDSGIPIEIA